MTSFVRIRIVDTVAGLEHLADLGQPLLVGASRKRFLGALLADESGAPRELDGRDAATHAITANLTGAQTATLAETLDRFVQAGLQGTAEWPS